MRFLIFALSIPALLYAAPPMPKRGHRRVIVTFTLPDNTTDAHLREIVRTLDGNPWEGVNVVYVQPYRSFQKDPFRDRPKWLDPMVQGSIPTPLQPK